MPKDRITIRKSELPKARRTWQRSPATAVKGSGKLYKRQKFKQNTKKAINNAKNR